MSPCPSTEEMRPTTAQHTEAISYYRHYLQSVASMTPQMIDHLVQCRVLSLDVKDARDAHLLIPSDQLNHDKAVEALSLLVAAEKALSAAEGNSVQQWRKESVDHTST